MTDKLQPLDNNIIAVLKNQYKKWLNLELFTKEEIPSKFDKIKKMTEILYSIRPEIGKYCWDSTIFRDNEHLNVPEEMIRSGVEVDEERTQKVTHMMDQMYIDESDEEVEFVDLIPVPDAEDVPEILIVSEIENGPEKTKVQSKITSFFTERKQK